VYFFLKKTKTLTTGELGLALEDSCDQTTWGVHLLDLSRRGLALERTIADIAERFNVTLYLVHAICELQGCDRRPRA